MDIVGKINGAEAVVSVSGRVESVNSADFETALRTFLRENPHTVVVLDTENLEYISSAGLRVLLRLRKDELSVRIINTPATVYEVLDMTGFTEMMHVQKAYRRVSVDGCKVIGTGATGVVYRLDADIIVKVYNEADALPDIHRERELARKAFVLGIPTAIPFDVVRVGDKYGSVFELLRAKSMAEQIIEQPQTLDGCIDLTVELMCRIHATSVRENELPSQKEKALAAADYMASYLTPEKAQKLQKMTAALPESLHMIHGDLHIKNMMLQDGEVLLIDMDTLSCGHPIFELAPLFNAYLGYSEIDKNNTMDFFGISYETAETLWQQTLARYLRTKDAARLAEAEDKIRLMGYVFLYRDFTKGKNEAPQGDERRQIDAYMQHILTLLDRVDSFDFALPTDSASDPLF